MNAIAWLESDRDYDAGLAIFAKLQPSNPVLSILNKGANAYNTFRLTKELTAASQKTPPLAPTAEPTAAKKHATAQLLNPTPQNYRKSRDQYPEELHAAYDRQNELYNVVNHIHPRLDTLYNTNIKECFSATKKLLAAWAEIDSIYVLLDYFSEHGVILNHKYESNPDDTWVSREELLKERNNLRTYISRSKNLPSKKDKVDAWQKRIKEIDLLLE